jgi:hypothetical protein
MALGIGDAAARLVREFHPSRLVKDSLSETAQASAGALPKRRRLEALAAEGGVG